MFRSKVKRSMFLMFREVGLQLAEQVVAYHPQDGLAVPERSPGAL